MSTDARLTTLEHAMAELALAQARTQANLDRLADEMRDFKEEMRADREAATAQMAAFQQEGRRHQTELSDFKEESRMAREAAAAQMAAFEEDGRRHRAEMRRMHGELSASMGTLAEDIVAPGIPDVFKTVFGVEPTGTTVRSSFRHPQHPGESQEFDVVAWGGGHFLVNETRKRARPEDIPVVLDLLGKARLYYPQAEAMRLVGSLASLYVDPSLVKGAERQGLLVFGLGGGLLEILNAPGFQPREY